LNIHTTFRLFFTAVILNALLIVPEITAQSTEKSDTIYRMEEIVVTSEPRSVPSENVIDENRVNAQRAGTVSEQLSGVPGALITVGSKNSAEIMIRGFDSDETLVMVDGRPVNDPYNGKIDLFSIGMGNISRIRVVKGATSVRYGPNAMAGAVNIITADERGYPLDIRMSAGSGDEFGTDVTHRGRSHGIGYVIHAGRNTSGGFPVSSDFQPTSLENGDVRNNSDFRRTDLNAKLLFGPKDNANWRLNLGSSHLAKGLPGSVYDPRYWRFKRWERMSVSLDGEPVRKDTFRVKTQVYVDRFLNELVDYRDDRYDMSNIYWDSTHDNRSAGFLLSSSYTGAKGITNTGMQVRWQESNRQADAGLDWYRNRTATNWLFAEHERALNDNIFIRGGLSGAAFTYKSWGKTAVSLNPSLYAEWNVRGTLVSGSVSRTSRFPTLNQLFSTTSGNPDLEPEWALKGEMSVSRTFPGAVHCSLTGFANRVHDMIYRAGKLNRYKNIETASLDGVELSAFLQQNAFDVSAAATMLDARDSDGLRLVYRPRWKFDLYVSWAVMSRARMYLSARAVGTRWTEFNTELDPYHTEDIGLMLFEDSGMSVSLRIRNIFDSGFEEEYGYPMAGRTFLAGIDMHIGKTR
jgi:outer membrane cobalamin receptor